MTMEVYGLTTRGRQMAKNTRSPDTPGWRIVHFLYSGRKTMEQICEYCDLTQSEVAYELRNNLKGVVAKE